MMISSLSMALLIIHSLPIPSRINLSDCLLLPGVWGMDHMGEPQTKQWGVLSFLIQLNDIMQLQVNSEVIWNASDYISHEEAVEDIRRFSKVRDSGLGFFFYLRFELCFVICNLL